MFGCQVGITGVGAATPLGIDYPTFAENLLHGRSGISLVERFDSSKHPSRIAGQLSKLPAPPAFTAAQFEQFTTWQQLILWCGVQALIDADLWERREQLRIGLVIGLGAEWILRWEADMHEGGDQIRHPERDRTGLAHWLKDELHLNGPVSTVAAACASGNIALGLGRMWVQRDWVDVCLAGACDLSVTPMGMAGFGNLGALSKRNEEPNRASRPFDRHRDGFVMSEGGAIYLLESFDSAQRRQAKLYAEVAGFGASSDAYHMAIPSSDPTPASKAIQSALNDARINPDQVDYINAHATSTTVGDPFETRALQSVFGEQIKAIPVSGTKSMTGHLLGAAAAVEVMACLAAFDRDALPPTINLEEIDPDCQVLRHIPNEAQEQKSELILSNSFGFGGSNTCLVLRKVA